MFMQFKCEVRGQGQLILCLHGFGGGPGEWRGVASELSHQYQLIIPNLTPLFSSSKPTSFSDQVALIANWLEREFPTSSPIHLLGSSYGGTLCWGLVMSYPERFISVSLINPMPLNPATRLRSRHLQMLFHVHRVPMILMLYLKSHWGQLHLSELIKIFRVGLNPRKSLNFLDPRKLKIIYQAIRRFMWIIKREDWTKWIRPSVEFHGLLITAGSDGLFSERDFLRYRDLTKNLAHYTLPDAGHMAIISHPQFIATKVLEFIHRISAGGSGSTTAGRLDRIRNSSQAA